MVESMAAGASDMPLSRVMKGSGETVVIARD
jgi:hypothetical protein